jgi:Leucine-rich repeat (LRR) protein
MNGTLPAAVGNLSALTALSLSNNRFSGSVPAQFSRLSALQQMDLSNNTFHGTIPASLANLKELNTLNLENNNFVGELPVTLLSKHMLSIDPLSVFTFKGNRYLTLPEDLGNLDSKVTKLDLGDSGLSGRIPESVGNLTALTDLVLSGNSIEGSITRNITLLTHLNYTQETPSR